MISHTQVFSDQAHRIARDRGVSYTDGWKLARALNPEGYAAMENEGRAVTHQMANEQARIDQNLNPAPAINFGPTEFDRFFPAWSFEALGLRAGATLGEMRQALRTGKRFGESQAYTLMTQLATGLETARGVLRMEAWQIWRIQFPELFADGGAVAFGRITLADGSAEQAGTRHAHIPPDRVYVTLFPPFLKEALTLDGSEDDLKVQQKLESNSAPSIGRETARRAIAEVGQALASREGISADRAEARLRKAFPQFFTIAGIR